MNNILSKYTKEEIIEAIGYLSVDWQIDGRRLPKKIANCCEEKEQMCSLNGVKNLLAKRTESIKPISDVNSVAESCPLKDFFLGGGINEYTKKT